MKIMRNILEINEELCNGCGHCILGCMEGAIAIIDGKAKIVKDSYCDGLGACLGHCPTGALKIIQREAEDFDEAAAMAHVAKLKQGQSGGCASLGVMDKGHHSKDGASHAHGLKHPPRSHAPRNWPLKIRLVPITAPFFQDADVIVAADCAAATAPYFQGKYVQDKVLLIGCPKLDNTEEYLEKLTAIFKNPSIKSCTVLRMEVPCCKGLASVVVEALKRAGSKLEAEHLVLDRTGAIAPLAPTARKLMPLIKK